MKRVC